MAGNSEGEEENYWPGYVDALTTMTMVLTFVMMVLGVMVFILSQGASRNFSNIIAKALNIDLQQVDAMSNDELQIAVLQAIGNGAGGGTGPASTGQSVATSPSETAGRLAPGPGGEVKVTSPDTFSARDYGAGGASSTGTGMLRLVFEPDAVQPSAETFAAVDAYVVGAENGGALVSALAVANKTSATEARRKAYYRAMLIRARLIKQGVSPTKIKVQVRDADRLDAPETVDVVKTAG